MANFITDIASFISLPHFTRLFLLFFKAITTFPILSNLYLLCVDTFLSPRENNYNTLRRLLKHLTNHNAKT